MMRYKKEKNRLPIIVLLTALLWPCAGFAQKPQALNNNSNEPLEISAGQTLEWHRNNKQYIARGQVIAKQGAVEIHGETLTADYREGQKNATDIWQLTAEQSVRIQNNTSTAYGEKAVYDVEKGYAVMTGNNLKLVSPDQTITARDKLEYWTVKGQASAIGKVKVISAEDSIQADKMKAFFKKDKQGRQVIERLDAIGNVIITTPQETLYGDKGFYKAATDTAELTGNVRIERGPNHLEGARAEVNLKTNISKMFSGTNKDKNERVRGIFYPKSKKDTNITPDIAEPTRQEDKIPVPNVPALQQPSDIKTTTP